MTYTKIDKILAGIDKILENWDKAMLEEIDKSIPGQIPAKYLKVPRKERGIGMYYCPYIPNFINEKSPEIEIFN
jgi:hypothetical protein